MNRDRISFIAGFLPPITMVMLMGVEYALARGTEQTGLVLALAGILPFLIPFVLIVLLRKLPREPVKLRLKGFTRRGIWFVLCMSVTATLFSFLVGSLASFLFNQSPYQQVAGTRILAESPLWMSLLVIVVIPSVCEELFFRSGMLGTFEAHGTYAAILVSALSFALVHGNPANLAGPFAAGLIYGYMCYVLGSVWPAVIAHLVNNVYYMIMSYATKAYESLGFWPYLMLILVLLFSFFLYLSMRALEKLIERGKVIRLRRVGFAKAALGVISTPGLWLLILMFVFKVIYQ